MQTTLGLAAPVFYGRVQPELYAPADPSVATGFTYVVGTAYNERPISLSFVLTTDANAANRQIGLALLDPFGATVAAMPVASVQAASLVYTYSFLAQVTTPSAVQALKVISPLMNWIIPPSYQLAVTIGSHQVGDQISVIRYYRDRFSTDPKDYEQGALDFESFLNSVRLSGAIVG